MGTIREAVEIEAPADRVWAVVHGDVPNLTRWSENLAHAEVIGGGPLREGSQLRYDVKIVAGTTAALTLLIEQFDQPRRCAGTMRGNLENLKAYVEAGKGPQGGRVAESPTPDSRNAP